ncbi:MAG: 3-deoxy-D-manno-octulosonic acid transferase [Alphaproteobacteria bacterium]
MTSSAEGVNHQRPAFHFAATMLGHLFALWVRHVARSKSGQRPGAKSGKEPVLLVPAADLPAASVASGAGTVVCLPPGGASDGLASFLKSCGATVWRQDGGEFLSDAPENLPKPGQTFLLPFTTCAHPSNTYSMAQALLVAARFKRPAARLRVEVAATVVFWPGANLAPRLPVAPVRLRAGPMVQNLATANARLAAVHSLALPGRTPATKPPSRGAVRPLLLRLYSGAMRVLEPALVLYLTMRAKRGKEIWDRLAERRGISALDRPPGMLGWIHAASVGESVSILPLVNQLLDNGHADAMLVTTGTATSAALMEIRLPEGAQHQFLPLDVPRYTKAFLDFWQPEFALFAESEIWPNLLHGLAQRGTPHAILNGRMSANSFNRWRRWPAVAQTTLGSCAVCLAQTGEFATRYAVLGAPSVLHTGNLKFDAPPLPADEGQLDQLRHDLHGRPVWLTASTHAGEEEIIAQVHYTLRERWPELLTILVPRHPERTTQISRMLEDRWLTTARRSTGSTISAKIDVYIADTVGELGLFYRLANIALVGGSLTADGGGHNPIEPAHLESAILHGPNVANFRDMYEIFDAGGGAIIVADTTDLIAQLDSLLGDPKRAARMAKANRARIQANAGSLERTISALQPVIGSPGK